ncbi:MAG: hydrogenase iron-sulfur subunit [Candidatus Hydrothermota bacterium]|nr:MAG: hydrogenase iron-sulfur subunit [Candidatus Hydrothermae bacterium]
MPEKFEPKIVGFFCNWCTSAAADLAGTSRLQYPPNIRPIKVMCSGTVDPVYIIRALLEGADGVIVGGCHPGDCHYIDGNFKARRRVKLVKEILNALGLDGERVKLAWISASEGPKFVKVMHQVTEEIREKGPNPMSKRTKE